MIPLNLELGISESTAQTAEAGRGNFILTGGGKGGLSGVLPKVSTEQAWLVWLGLALVAAAGVVAFFRFKK